MNDAHPILRRWDALPRSDRKAVLARLTADQQRGLMAMIEAESRAVRGHPAGGATAGDWAIFSPPLAQVLRALEADPEASPAGQRVTPATAALLLATARQFRKSNDEPESRIQAMRRRWRQWLKDMDL